MKIEPLARLERHAKRIGEIVTILGRYGLANLFGSFDYPWLKQWLKGADGQVLSDLTTPQRVRRALTEMGTTFIKLGQMLSTRADLIGIELANELASLQSSVPPDSAESARKTIKAALERGVGELFARFDDEPLAAASIAQVHRAVLKSGEQVVVKVRRSGILAQVTTDLEIVQWMAELLEKHSPRVRPYQPVAVVRQFRRTLLKELDFTYEKRNLEEFALNFFDDETVQIPTVYEDHCSHDVVTMDWLDGVSGTKMDAMRESEEDLVEFARRGAMMYLNMVFRDGFYHADPHPGNLMLMQGCTVGVIDCGMVGRIDEELRIEVETLLLAIVENDSDRVTEQVLRLGSVPNDLPRERLRTDLQDFMADYMGHPLSDIDVGKALSSLIEIIRRYQVVLPPPLALLLKTLIVLEGTSRRFNPDFSLAEMMKPFCAGMVRRQLAPSRIMKRIRRAYYDWDRLITALPRDVSDLLGRFREGKLTVHLDHRHLDPIVNRLVIGVLTAALFLGSSELWGRQAPPLLWGVSVFGALGYLTAIVLGFRLLWAIRKSGNIRSKD